MARMTLAQAITRITELEAEVTSLKSARVTHIKGDPNRTVRVNCRDRKCTIKQEVSVVEAPGWACAEHSH